MASGGQESLQQVSSVRPRRGLLLIPVFTLLALLAGHAFSLRQWASAHRDLVQSKKATNAVLELKFQSADLNGWQTAYAFAFSRDPREGEPRFRKQFLTASQRFREQLEVVRPRLVSDEERAVLSKLLSTFEGFMGVDVEIMAAYGSGDPDRIRWGHDQVLGTELDRFGEIVSGTDTLVQLVHRRSQESLAYNLQQTGATRWLQWSAGALGLLLSAGLTMLLWRSMNRTTALVKELSYQAHIDPLTELPNRRTWNARLGSEVSRAQRLAYPLSIVAIDLDHFKAFNDQRGHSEGDELLRSAARAWTQALREGDLLVRIGGEEFALLLPGCSAADANDLVRRLRDVTPSDQTFSAGVALLKSQEAPAEFYERADAALYQAKELGRNRSVVAA